MDHEKIYNFDEIIPRKNTNSSKWDYEYYKTSGLDNDNDNPVLSMWISDMDFQCSDEIIRSIRDRCDHGIFGYTIPSDLYFDSIINWMKHKQNWSIDPEWIVISPGIKAALNVLIETFVPVGYKVIIQPPVYFDFVTYIENHNAKVVNNPLIQDKNGYYHIDFKDLEEKAKDPETSMMILCSPHNPIGRIWTKEEMEHISTICRYNNVLLVSDESFSDLIMPTEIFTSMGCLEQNLYKNAFICTSPGKTFNISGTQNANIIIPNKSLRSRFNKTLMKHGLSRINPFGLDTTIAAYNHGEVWLNQVINYIYNNYKFLEEFCKNRIPQIKVIKLEATYLAWIDCRDLKMEFYDLENVLLNTIKVHFDPGSWFGEEGKGYQRVNLACSRYILEEALIRIESHIK